MQRKRRHILLLEVHKLTIIVLCIFPLIYPHAAMAKSQREIIKKIEYGSCGDLYCFRQDLPRLQQYKLNRGDIESKRKVRFTPQEL